jgi:hypothetical protein
MSDASTGAWAPNVNARSSPIQRPPDYPCLRAHGAPQAGNMDALLGRRSGFDQADMIGRGTGVPPVA